MKPQITVGMRVAFDSEHGPQIGWVTGLMPCISNGQQHAAIEIEHELDGIVFMMPVAALTVAPHAALTTDDYRNLHEMLGVDSGLFFHPATSDEKASMLRLVDHGMVRQVRDTFGKSHFQTYYTATPCGCAAIGLIWPRTLRIVDGF